MEGTKEGTILCCTWKLLCNVHAETDFPARTTENKKTWNRLGAYRTRTKDLTSVPTSRRGEAGGAEDQLREDGNPQLQTEGRLQKPSKSQRRQRKTSVQACCRPSCETKNKENIQKQQEKASTLSTGRRAEREPFLETPRAHEELPARFTVGRTGRRLCTGRASSSLKEKQGVHGRWTADNWPPADLLLQSAPREFSKRKLNCPRSSARAGGTAGWRWLPKQGKATARGILGPELHSGAFIPKNGNLGSHGPQAARSWQLYL